MSCHCEGLYLREGVTSVIDTGTHVITGCPSCKNNVRIWRHWKRTMMMISTVAIVRWDGKTENIIQSGYSPNRSCNSTYLLCSEWESSCWGPHLCSQRGQRHCGTSSTVGPINAMGLFVVSLLEFCYFIRNIVIKTVNHLSAANIFTRIKTLWLGQPIFWPNNLKFWLYNWQILTLFLPVNFLRLQLQNNSAVGVEVSPETYSCTLCFEILKHLVV